ncbi:hypothetical protein M413DRAFT_17888 [Hebeloma cylindrosporum]|uniref:Homeobox domain-containing protein n=1 Tax=Hebeloma cylindrosporum TaxID=76867 RepID=A0A0C3CIN3_HEBCY|nr:hypothetical protein M413DRAFT_17888 [Hebeloma cylindrosporum h7]
MSKSRSPSPTHNLSSPLNNSRNSPESTTSRPKLIEEHPTEPLLASDDRVQPITVSLSSPPPGETSEPSSSKRPSSHIVQSAEGSPKEPMAKRIRRASPETRESHSSPASDSQDDMADNEMDVGRLVDRPEPLPPTSAPPKKKRTRTLTTPHQSAVLHALLAQSRFPTTAMREEVGRSIGLSARKVQNQRQKARRPRSQSDTPSARPSQYGPYPGVPDSVSQNVHGYEERGGERLPYSRRLSPEAQPSVELPARLLGPGMPGAPLYPPQPGYRQVLPPLPSAPIGEYRFPAGHGSQRGLSPEPYNSPRMYPLPGVRPATSQPSSWRERDPSRTLPPLVSTRPSSSTYGARTISSMGAHPYMPSRQLVPPRSISPEIRFAHQPPEPAPRVQMNLPPPFTLQPAPQWDESSYSVFPRPTSSAWSRPGTSSTGGRSSSPITSRRGYMSSIGERNETYYLAEHAPIPHSASPRSIPRTSTPPSRPGRYDPVRSTFVPFSTRSVSPARSPARSGGCSGGDRRPDQSVSPFLEER